MELLTNPYVVAGVVVIAVFTLYMLVVGVAERRDKSQQLEAKIIGEHSNVSDYALPDEELLGVDQEKSATAKGLEGFLSMFLNMETQYTDMKKQLGQAGITSPDAPAYTLFVMYIAGPVLALLGVLILLSAGDKVNMLLGVLMIFLGLMGAKLYIKNKLQRRQTVLMRSFPDTLDLLVVCVESGLALDAALGRVCNELGKAHPEITRELNQTRLELALLNDRSQALQNMAERTNLVSFRSLVAALIQTEKFGTSLADTLRVLSDDYRQTRLNMAEEKAARLPVLMTIPLICLLLPALVLVIMGPAILKISAQGGLFGNGN